jgi:uncharacterized repeat protein (TIGR01451 family)
LRFFKALCLLALLAAALAWGPDNVRAATNSVQAGIGDVNNDTLTGGDGSGTAQITINAAGLILVKQARDLTGTIVPNGADVTPGRVIYFVLHVNNPTPYPAGDVRLTDLLNETEFTYIPGSIESTIVPAGSTSAAIWSGTWTPLSDDLGAPDDIAAITDSGGPPGRDKLTVGAVAGQANKTLNIPAASLQAIRFRVRVN